MKVAIARVVVALMHWAMKHPAVYEAMLDRVAQSFVDAAKRKGAPK